MSIFEKIEIKNFRSISELELGNFKQFNAIVGKNDTGKTSVLEALYITINPGNPNLPVVANAHRGIDALDSIQFWLSLYKDYNVDKHIEVDSLVFKTHKINLKIKPKLTQTSIASENLTIDISNQSVSAEQKVQGLETQLTYDWNQNKPYKPSTSYKTEIAFSPNNPKNPVSTKVSENWKPIMNGVYLSISNTFGPDLAIRVGELITLKEEKELVKVLQELENRIKDINLYGASRVLVDIEGLPQRILINSLGEGIYRIANIITLIYRSRNGVVLIDELETGLDRNSQHKLMKAIFKAAIKYNVQIFFITHSIDLIDTFYEIATSEDNEENISLVRLEKDNERVTHPVYFDYKKIQFSRNQGWEIR